MKPSISLRITVAALCVLIGLSFAGCGDHASPPDADPSNAIKSTPSAALPTPMPTPDPAPVPVIPLFLKGKAEAGLKIGKAAISDKTYLYVVEPGKKNVLYRITRKTGKKTKLRTFGAGVGIRSLFLDGEGALYYVSADGKGTEGASETAAQIHRYMPDGDLPVAGDVYAILRVDKSAIYFAFDNYMKQKAGFCRYDFISGATEVILEFDGYFDSVNALQCRPAAIYRRGYLDGGVNFSDPHYRCVELRTGAACDVFEANATALFTGDGNHVLVRSPDKKEAVIADFNRLTEKYISFATQATEDFALILGSTLYMIDCVDGFQQSEVFTYDISTGKVSSKFRMDCVGHAVYENNVWYLYTYNYSAQALGPANNRLFSFKPETGKAGQIYQLGDAAQREQTSIQFEMEAGKIWVLYCNEQVKTYDLWKSLPVK